MTSALVPSMPMPASMHAAVWSSTISRPGHLVAAHAAVVRALGGGVADGRPTQRPAVLEEGVLLLDPEHRLLVAVPLDHLPQSGPGIGGVRGEVGQFDLTHDQLVVGAPQRVGDHEHRTQDAVGVVAQGLIGARTVESPDPGLLAVGDDFGLAAEERRWFGPVDPDVLSLIRHMYSLLLDFSSVLLQLLYHRLTGRRSAPGDDEVAVLDQFTITAGRFCPVSRL